METTQLVIIVSIISISAVFVCCGIWFILVLKELKTTIQKASNVIDDAHSMTASIAEPLCSLSEFLMGFKNSLHIFNSLFGKKQKAKT